MERQVMAIFKKILFDPIVFVVLDTHPAISPKKILNAAKDDLAEAMRKGDVQYHDGVFSGTFRARTSRALREMGAVFDQRSKTYKINPANVPSEVKTSAALYAMKAKETNAAIARKLDDVQASLDTILARSEVNAQSLVGRVVKDFHDVARKIEIPVNMSEDSKRRMATEYSQNMNLWIKKWCEEEIQELRGKVEQNAEGGYRFDRLIGAIQSRYSVSKSKAQFLARQETSLFVSKFREEHFGDAGITRYRWRTSHDERVRPAPWVKGKARLDNHRILDGKIFYYSSPPVVDMASGRRANPGQDYNCRCVDEPVLEPVHATA